MSVITVFTPTYNRAHLLFRGYEALRRQTCMDFEWMIVDDGSTDNTRQVVSTWIEQERQFRIRYYYKENGGLYTAYNEAISHLETELAVCIDSDDYLPENGIKFILDYWKEHGSEKYAGIIGLDFYPDGRPIGEPLPNVYAINLIDIAVGKYKMKKVDRKLVLRSELYQSVAPMKGFLGEKYFNPSYMHMEISQKYDFLVLNENLCFVDYQSTGMSSNIWRQYYNSPQSFAEMRKQNLGFKNMPLYYQFKEYVHYISSCLIAKKDCGLENRNWFIMAVAFPFGVLLYIVTCVKKN